MTPDEHYIDVIKQRWRLKSPASWLFIQSFIQAQIKENIKAPRHWPMWGNSPGPVNSPHKGPVTRKMFPFDDVFMEYISIPLKLCFNVEWIPICSRELAVIMRTYLIYASRCFNHVGLVWAREIQSVGLWLHPILDFTCLITVGSRENMGPSSPQYRLASYNSPVISANLCLSYG